MKIAALVATCGCEQSAGKNTPESRGILCVGTSLEFQLPTQTEFV